MRCFYCFILINHWVQINDHLNKNEPPILQTEYIQQLDETSRKDYMKAFAVEFTKKNPES